MRLLVAASLAALICATPGLAQADAKSDLEKAHNAYMAHKYDEAESRLRALLDPATTSLKDPDSIADARMYLAAVLLAEKKSEERNEPLKVKAHEEDMRSQNVKAARAAVIRAQLPPRKR